MYNCNQLSQCLKQALEKDSGIKWKQGNNEWSPIYGGAHSCTAKMAVLNQPAAALLARVDSQSACWNIFNSDGSRISLRGVHKVGRAWAPAKILQTTPTSGKNTPFYVLNNTPGVELGVCLRFILAACSLEVVYTGTIAITVDTKNEDMAINSYNNTSSLWIIINKGSKRGSLAPLDPP